MKKLKSLLFNWLPNAAHYNFFMSLAYAPASAAVKAALGALNQELGVWLAKASALMDWVKRSVLTAQIAEADHRMDQALVALNAQVRAQTYNHTADIATAAHDIYVMLKNYGRVYTKPYEEQEGNVRAIVDQLLGTYAAGVTLLGIGAYLSELQDAFIEFRTLLGQRDAKVVTKPEDSFPVVRRGLENVYHRMTVIINAGAALNTDPGFAALIDVLNPEIDRLNNEYHRARKDISVGEHCVVEPIDTQAFTERAVTPIPVAYYREDGKETKRLVFAKDFSVTYRNNTNVGTADLTLHGKGDYRGQKTVTFAIKRVN